MALNAGTFVQVMHYGGVPAAGTHHRMTDTVADKQRSEYVYIFLITEHLSILFSVEYYFPHRSHLGYGLFPFTLLFAVLQYAASGIQVVAGGEKFHAP